MKEPLTNFIVNPSSQLDGE